MNTTNNEPEMKIFDTSNIISDRKDNDLVSADLNEIIELRDVKAIEIDLTKGSYFKQFCSIFGGSILISMAALDPGNIAADISIANTTGLRCLWILLLAHILCYYYQDASLSVAMGAKMDVARTGSRVFNKKTSYSLWIMIELALISADTQEILGAAIG